MKVKLGADAELELVGGARYYAQEGNTQLALAFIAEFERSVELLRQHRNSVPSGAATPEDFLRGASHSTSCMGRSPRNFESLPSRIKAAGPATGEVGKYKIKFMVEDGTDYEKTTIMKLGQMAPGAAPGNCASGRPSAFGALPGASNSIGPATIRVMNGAAANREVVLTKVVTTVGKPGVQVASITKRPTGYVLAYVEGAARPTVDSTPLVGETVSRAGSYAETSTYSTLLCGTGGVTPSSRIPSRWKAIASRISSSVSATVAPVATHPGKSGTYAE